MKYYKDTWTDDDPWTTDKTLVVGDFKLTAVVVPIEKLDGVIWYRVGIRVEISGTQQVQDGHTLPGLRYFIHRKHRTVSTRCPDNFLKDKVGGFTYHHPEDGPLVVKGASHNPEPLAGHRLQKVFEAAEKLAWNNYYQR